MQIPILIDTDAGEDIDDVLAIAFAALRPEFSIKAVTTVTHGTQRRAHLVQKLMEAAGYDEIPVASGMELPLRSLSDEEMKRVTDSAYVLNHAVFETERTPGDDAVGLIIRTVEENAGELGIVTIGPMTNIACALRKAPHIAGKIRWIASMGGEVHIPHIEHNVEWDYLAASLVISSGVPLFLGTWSVTRGFRLSPDECDFIKAQDTPICRFLAQCIDHWWPHKAGKEGPVMYDTAPFVWGMGRDLYTTELMSIQVETKGELTSGATVRRGSEANAQVSVAMDVDGVRKLYLDTILTAMK
jgi:purine nucleosidase